MKHYKFLDPDDDKYEIVIPREVIKDIILNLNVYNLLIALCIIYNNFLILI
jgi:hypothetical protein